MAEETSVSFSLKDIFKEIKDQLTAIAVKLDLKADLTELNALEKRVDDLETWVTAKNAVTTDRRWLFGLAGGLLFNIVLELLKLFGVV